MSYTVGLTQQDHLPKGTWVNPYNLHFRFEQGQLAVSREQARRRNASWVLRRAGSEGGGVHA